MQLGDYSFAQSSSGFYFPFLTRDYHKDTNVIANLHMLVVGSFLKMMPHFDSIPEDHQLTKGSLGLRIMYNNGKKNVWFFNFAPCVSKDNQSDVVTNARFTSLIVFNRTVSRNFSYRIGFTRTFLFGNKYHLPVLGLRFGALDGVYLNVMFPRNISLNFPIGRKWDGSIYCKPFGGVYDFANTDSLYSGRNDSIIQFGRREYIAGAKFEYNAGKHFSFFLSSGLSMGNQVDFFSYTYNPKKFNILAPFYKADLPNSYFLNFGLTFRFGKVKKAYNNYTMYDLMDLNNTIDPGDVNDGPGNGSIPRNGNRTSVKDIQYKDVKDLLELDDNF